MPAPTYHWYNVHHQEWTEFSFQEDMSWPYSDFLPHLAPKAKILDLGCAAGRDLIHFQKRGFSAEGLDGSIELCNEARKRTRVEVFHQDFDELNLAPNTYDGIFANAVLMHVYPEKRIAFLKVIYASLKENGIFYAHYPKGTQTEIHEDGRILHLTMHWPELCSQFNWREELNEGRPAFLSPEEQNWQVIRYRKSSISD